MDNQMIVVRHEAESDELTVCLKQVFAEPLSEESVVLWLEEYRLLVVTAVVEVVVFFREVVQGSVRSPSFL